MNRDNFIRLIEHLKSAEKKPALDMRSYFCAPHEKYAYSELKYSPREWCGTAACIAGHVVYLEVMAGHIEIIAANNTDDFARNWLGIESVALARALFLQWYDARSSEEAIAKLQQCLDMPNEASATRAITEINRHGLGFWAEAKAPS